MTRRLSVSCDQSCDLSLKQMQNDEMRQMMSNPEALRAMMQVQQGMQQLQQSAPGLFGGLG